MIKLSDISNLVLSGGGLLGLSYIGLFRYLEEHNTIHQIKTITGCSAGAIFGTFLAIGFKSEELIQIFKSMHFPDYLNITADSIINFMSTKGLESGKNVMTLIKKCIKDKTGDENITFCQLRDKFNIQLHIGITNITKAQFELVGCHNMPDLSVYKAINASIAIPFIFEPVVINDDIYCDGGLLDNLPIEYILKLITNNTTNSHEINENENEKTIDSRIVVDTLGIYLMNNFNTLNSTNYQSSPLSHYLAAIMHTICNEFITNKINNELKDEKIKNRYKIIVFEIPCDIMTFIKLNATHEDVENIINIAYTTTTKSLI
jgi:predicted acylesterase/phospholipase RssA